MRIRGFAMPQGVCFSNGKRRMTGRLLSNGQCVIKHGTRWYWRFSTRQWIAALALIGLELIDLLWPGHIPRSLYFFLLIGLFFTMIRLKASHRRFHGAEHIAVNLWEGQEASILHPGCGSNLVLLILPAIALSMLPVHWLISLGIVGFYGGVMTFLVWPYLYRGLRQGNAIAGIWWKVTRRWQRFFVAEPFPEEVQLACATLQVLTGRRSS